MRSTVLFIFYILFSGIVLAQPAQKHEIVSAQKAKALRESVKKLLSIIPASETSMEGMVAHCKLETSCYTDYIDNTIQLAAYNGILQGAQGVFETATGNSLEVSLLLKELLERIGFSVRIAKASLSGEQVQKLSQKIFTTGTNTRILPKEVVLSSFSGYADASGISKSALEKRYDKLTNKEPWRDSQIYQKAALLSKRLFKSLNQELPVELDKNIAKQIRKNLSTYYFPQFRLEPGKPWMNYYFGLSEDTPLKIESFWSPGTESSHSVTIQSFIKREIGEKVEVVKVSDKVRFQTDEVLGVDLHYMAAPDNIYKIVESGASPEQLDKVAGFIPMLNAEALDGAMAFDLEGNTFKPSKVAMPVAALAGSIEKAGNKALGAISNALPKSSAANSSGNAEKTSKLLQHFLVIEWIDSEGSSKSYQRVLYDSSRNQAHAALAISQLFTLHSSYAPLRQSVLLEAQLKRSLSLLQSIEKGKIDEQTTLRRMYEIFANPIRKTRDIRFDFVTLLSDSVRQQEERVLRFGPVLQALWEVAPSNDLTKGYLAMDVLQDEAVVLKNKTVNSEKGFEYDPKATFEHGIWLSFAENIAINGITLERDKLKDSIKSGVKELEKFLEQNEHLKNTGKKDGIVEFRPEASAQFAVMINSDTGMPLVMDAYGRGGSLTEYQILLLKVGIATLKGVIKIALCVGDGSRGKQLACILCEATAAILGILDGGLGIGDAAGFMATEFGGDMVCAGLGRAMS